MNRFKRLSLPTTTLLIIIILNNIVRQLSINTIARENFANAQNYTAQRKNNPNALNDSHIIYLQTLKKTEITFFILFLFANYS